MSGVTGQRGEALVEINFRILGQTAVRVGDRFVSTQSKPLGLLSVLLLRTCQPVPVSELIDWIWPDDKVPGDPAGTLYTYRKRISAVLEKMDNPPKINVRGGTYRLDVDREEIDFHEFRDRVRRARIVARLGDHASAALTLASAVDELWTGFPLPDLGGARAENWRRMAVADHLLPAHGALLQSLSGLGEHDEVLRRLSDLPLDLQADLTLVKQRIIALRGLQRFEDATSCFVGNAQRLIDEGNDDGADELKRFHEEVARHGHDQQPVALSSPSAAEVLNLLPHDVPDFTGREVLLRKLDAFTTAAESEPPATITVLSGEPGVGKTAFALRWAHQAGSRFPGGRFYKNLNGFAGGPKVEQSEVVAELLGALGFPADGIPSEAGRMVKLRSLLSGPRTLVVLDNVRDSEHVLPLLDCLSNCTVVLTSRQRLSRLTRVGAFSLPVPPLNYAESKTWLVKWLGERAEPESVAIGDLAALCNGVPLALRIVADHVTSRPKVPLGEFVDELWDEQTLLALGDHGDGPDGSVRAALSWSYRALDPREQRLFRLLGINPGPDISLAAAAALLGQDSRTTKKGLDILVDAHLLGQPESRDRYRFHDLLRGYARELAVESDEFAAAEERLLGFFLASAQNADQVVVPNGARVTIPPVPAGVVPIEFNGEKSAMKWAYRERVNIMSLIRYAVDRNSGLEVYVSKYPSVIGEIWTRQGHGVEVAAALRLAIVSAQKMGNDLDAASWMGNLGYILIGLRDFESSWESVMSAKVMFEQIGYPLGIAIMRHLLGRIQLERDVRKGIETQLSALAELRRIDARGQEVIALYRLGEAYRRAGNLDAAASFCRDALWSADRLGDIHIKGCVFAELASIHLERGNLAESRGYCERALEIHEPDDPAESGKVYSTLASIHLDQREYRDAELCARRALTFCRSARDGRGQAGALRTIAELLYRQARHEEAVKSWRVALSLLEAADDRYAAAAVRNRLAEVASIPPEIPLERTEAMENASQKRRSPLVP
ncbi:AfsR/SARP family transcriptional regulator [Amycolatopsis sp.]|uniref:AfsR/SARP family transcriptional regulator n=1 Tax=Amycolatopsis sp. TaxID=37632 RepID=UPI002DFA22A7|nr:tetratricopeptide repeat protein [Amycolatopsis sp.]